MNLRDTYNKIAEDWHREHQPDNWWAEGTDKFISFLAPGALVLDVGCGTGIKSKYLTQGGLSVVGIDFSDKMIEIAKREVPEGTFFVLDFYEIDKLDYLFDGVFMQAALLHVPKKEVVAALKKIATKLKNGGYFYLAVKEGRPGEPEEKIEVESDYGYPYERFFSYFIPDEIKSYLKELGFEVGYFDVKTSGKRNWIQAIGKK